MGRRFAESIYEADASSLWPRWKQDKLARHLSTLMTGGKQNKREKDLARREQIQESLGLIIADSGGSKTWRSISAVMESIQDERNL